MTQCLLAAGGTHDVRISHIENGAKTFYVQLTSNLELIGELSKRMQTSWQQPSMILEGSVYLVRQGRLVYRGLLVSVDPLRARLIDFGNIVDADYKDLCQLPAPFDKFGQMAYRFSLAGVCGNPRLSFNPDAVERFKSLAQATHQFQLKVVAADGPPTSQYCELYKNNVSILTTLEDELGKTVVNYEKRQFLQANIEHAVFVSFVETKTQTLPWTFFVQMASEKSRLQALSSELMQFCSSVGAANADQLVEDSPMLAKFNDQWYRGLLLQKVAHGCSVYFVDHGNTEIVPLENLRMPPSSMANYMPEQAIKCILDGCSSNLDARDIMEKLIHPKVSLSSYIYLFLNEKLKIVFNCN
jgi:Tudor domain